MNYPALERQAAARALALLGGFHDGETTTLLLGPDPATFWATLTASPEWRGPDPVDRWSRRVLTAWAAEIGAEPRFPFGQPLQPFVTWMTRTGRCHVSPAHLLAHNTQGLMVSARGALVLPRRIALPDPPPSPCAHCHAPCLTACPAGAIDAAGYDLAACHAHLSGPNDCMARGCAVRRACPASPTRPQAQSAHHMAHFHRESP
ncbi:ferredoxin [Jannaschia formosa]|uniref:ferredoxin n=1 Tax=Jannaschia formosa TaxID=2259592 RepID=UPI000E1B8103|nr:ferredoxin [Jannaschia formosa]TFL17967.1 ferredoxin [Jannaschia formosa]